MNVEVAHADAWGVRCVSARDDAGKAGVRLVLRTETLLGLLSLIHKRLVLLVKAQRYVKDGAEKLPRRRGGMRAVPFRTRTLVLVVSSDGQIEVVRRVPLVVRKAVAGMEEERYDFYARLARIAGALGGVA